MRDLWITGLIVGWLALVGHAIVRAGWLGVLVVTVGVVLIGIAPGVVERWLNRRFSGT